MTPTVGQQLAAVIFDVIDEDEHAPLFHWMRTYSPGGDGLRTPAGAKAFLKLAADPRAQEIGSQLPLWRRMIEDAWLAIELAQNETLWQQETMPCAN